MELSCSARAKRREGLLAAAEAMFTEDLGCHIFGFESDSARAFSMIAAHRRVLGRPISHVDAQIAAIAQPSARGEACDAHCCRLRGLWR
jgi:predicted nucleic acid-binding protein